MYRLNILLTSLCIQCSIPFYIGVISVKKNNVVRTLNCVLMEKRFFFFMYKLIAYLYVFE